jgi:hypothetical protein
MRMRMKKKKKKKKKKKNNNNNNNNNIAMAMRMLRMRSGVEGRSVLRAYLIIRPESSRMAIMGMTAMTILSKDRVME